MSDLWLNEGRTPTAFTSLPPAANNTGRTMLVSPLVVGQPYLYMISDGTYWRPCNGRQTLYCLSANILGTTTADPELLITIPIPALLIPDGRIQLRITAGFDKLLGTSDTVNFYQRFGTAGTTSDAVLAQSTLATTVISHGTYNEFNRVSATELRKHGAGGVTIVNSMSGQTTVVRAAAITVGNLGTTLNYLTLWSDLTTSGTEKGNVHAFTVEILG